MHSWSIIILLFTIPPSLGVLIDKHLLTKKEKGWLYDKLFGIWVKLDNSRIHKLYIVAIECFLNKINYLFGGKIISPKFFMSSFGISACLTTVAILLGKFLNNTLTLNFSMEFKRILMYIGVYLLNYAFDFLTIFITIILLRLICRTRSIWHIFIILLDIIIGVFIAYCIAIFFVLARVAVGIDPHPMHGLFNYVKYYPLWLINNLDHNSYKYLFASLTSIIPTGIYLICILLFLILKMSISLIGRIFYVLLEQNADDNVPVFSTFGAFFAFIGLIINVVVNVIDIS